MNKRGVSLWVSFIILIGLVVALSTFMYSWFVSTSERSVESFKYVYDNTECDNVAIQIDICSETQHLNMNISNKLYIDIDELIFRIFYTDASIDTDNTTTLIRPGDQKDFRIDYDNSKEISVVEILPVIYTEDSKVICRQRMARAEELVSC